MFVSPLTETILTTRGGSLSTSFEVFQAGNSGTGDWLAHLLGAINRHEAWCVLDHYGDGNPLAVAAVSIESNAVTLLAAKTGCSQSEVIHTLSKTLIKQLDPTREMIILAETKGSWEPIVVPPKPDDVRGASFHYNYQRYMKWSEPEQCPVCLSVPGPSDIVTIFELLHSWVEATPHAQGGLYGKCHVLCKGHFVELYDMDESSLLGFMSDVQIAARALKSVTGAVKINYEIHGNSMPHLHAHLFPRYVDDPFPSAPIDYRVTKPDTYEDSRGFEGFVEAMRQAIDRFLQTLPD